MTTRTVSGYLIDPTGNPVASALVSLTPEAKRVVGILTAGLVPKTVTASTDASGWLSVDLEPGSYLLTVISSGTSFVGTLNVPDGTDPLPLADALEQAPPAPNIAASEAVAALREFQGIYLGAYPSTSLPTADPNGNPLEAGDLCWASDTNSLMVWDGAAWVSYDPTTAPAHTHDLAGSDLTGVLPLGKGGTGQTTAGAALDALGGAPRARVISTGTGLTGGGDLSADRTLEAVTLPQTDWDAGTLTTEAVISPAKLAGAVGALAPTGLFTSVWESSPFVGALGTRYTFTHNLGVVPALLLLVGVFKTNVGWFSAGETMLFAMSSNNRYSNNSGVAMSCTSADIKLVFDTGRLAKIYDGVTTINLLPQQFDFVVRAYA